jgi:hypothetical protein
VFEETFRSKNPGNDVKSPYADIRIVYEVRQAVKYAVDSIENQHNTLLSVLLSVLLGVVCSKVVEEFLRHGIPVLWDAIVLRSLILFFAITLFIGSLLIIGFYLLLRGGYSSTFTLVFDASPHSKDWRNLLRTVVATLEAYHVCNVGCRDVASRNEVGYEYLICYNVYKGSIPLEMKLYLFKAAKVIPLTVTLVANPLKVAVEELRNTSLLNKLRVWRRRDYYMELGIWYEAIEDLVFYFDDLVKAFSRLDTPLIDVIY